MAVASETAVPTREALGAGIQQLVDYAAACELIAWEDRVWAYNTALECTGATEPAPETAWVLAGAHEASVEPFDLEATLALLAEAAVANGAAEDTTSGRDRIAMRIMGALMPRPSEVAAGFRARIDAGEAARATDWFYRLCCDAGYVRRAAIARNIAWTSPTAWGDLEITINLSKPEKDPREIAAAGAAANTGAVYPACQLCIENEGFGGRSAAAGHAHPARQNLRIVPIELGGERWGLQYSPYAYFNEHCIAMSAHHRPMHIDESALRCLLDFVDLLPHYFIGSNADLPVVGGSILSHDHFQGGAHEFPMMRAEVASSFEMPGFAGVSGAVMRGPLSVVRLRTTDSAELLAAATHVIDAWRGWSDADAGIVAHTPDGAAHNTVTPIVRRVDEQGRAGGARYEAYLALRCNIASDEHPLGVFHPHAQWHHIKKENIGLIEVMGLAILPPRLVSELAAVRGQLLAAASGDLTRAQLADALAADARCASHAAWALEIFDRRASELTDEACEEILREEVGAVFGHVLADAGVFKWDEAGRAAQQRFIDAL